MDAGSDIADFSRRDITLLGKTKPVLLTGATGPARYCHPRGVRLYPNARALLPLGARCWVPSVLAGPVRLAQC